MCPELNIYKDANGQQWPKPDEREIPRVYRTGPNSTLPGHSKRTVVPHRPPHKVDIDMVKPGPLIITNKVLGH